VTRSGAFSILDYWGLKASPFPMRPALDSVTSTPSQEEALARMEFLVHNRGSGGLIVGAAGTGKTLLLALFAELIRPVAETYRFSVVGLDDVTLIARLAEATGMKPIPSRNPLRLRQTIEARFAAAAYQGRPWVILLDDIAEASPKIAVALTYLSHLRWDAGPAPLLFVAARHATLHRVPRQCLDLLDLRIDLEPWEEDGVQTYLIQRLQAAGQDDWQAVFHAEAMHRIAALSRGIPREVNRLADLSLTAAAGANVRPIDAETAQAVFDELYPGNERKRPLRESTAKQWEIRVQ